MGRNKSSLAVVSLETEKSPEPEFKDGEEGGDESETLQVTIDVAKNGWITTVHRGEELIQKVFVHDGPREHGNHALIREVIDALGLTEKVRLKDDTPSR